DGHLYSIIGVLPPSFELAEESHQPEVVLPLVFSPDDMNDIGANYTAIGRLRAGVSHAQIADEIARLSANYTRAFPERTEKDEGDVVAMTYDEIFNTTLIPQLWIMLGATAFVFMLACANVANLVLARARTRERELAVRAALGAGRSRIIRQLVVEMTLLGVLAAAVATPASLATVRALVGLADGALLRTTQLRLDPLVVALTTLVAVAASIVIGLVVAIAATGSDVTRSLTGSARTTGIGGSASRRTARSV